MSTTEFVFSINMSYQKCSELYLDHIKNVVVTSQCGKRIQIPKINLKPFLKHNGIVGKFKLKLDENNKIIDISYLK